MRSDRDRTTPITEHGSPDAESLPLERARVGVRRMPLRFLRETGAGLWGSDARALIERMRDEWT
jgi:hypothetical protein